MCVGRGVGQFGGGGGRGCLRMWVGQFGRGNGWIRMRWASLGKGRGG